MKSFESINQIFEQRADFIPEVGEQLSEKTTAEIELNGEKLDLDYRVISVEKKKNPESDPVVVLPGFGSGWEGISELGFSLACEGREVILPSLPGYGNSEDPSKKYYEADGFDSEVEAISKLLEKIEMSDKKIHLVGHSMASEVLATFAEKYPDKVSSLVLLNPSGVEKEETSILGAKFAVSGIHAATEFSLRMAFSGEEDYEKALKEHIPKSKSPFAKDRLKQRLAEAKKLSKGGLLEKLKKLEIPITYISGELDAVYPPGKEGDENSQLARVIEAVSDNVKIEKSVIAGLRHNTTLAPDEITAANIEHYMAKAEKARKKN